MSKKPGDGVGVSIEIADAALRALFRGLPEARVKALVTSVREEAAEGTLATSVNPDAFLYAVWISSPPLVLSLTCSEFSYCVLSYDACGINRPF